MAKKHSSNTATDPTPAKSKSSKVSDKTDLTGNAEQALKTRAWIKSGASRSERKEFGKAAREKTPLAAHAKPLISGQQRDVVQVLEDSNVGRLPDLIPLRYGRMLSSAFNFYRGSAALMAKDLAVTPNSGFIVQACGDCHIHNFGAFATPERRIVIDINDFDETLPAPWEWDVKRLSASLVLAAKDRGFSNDLAHEAAWLMAQSYRCYMNELSSMSALEIWYSQISAENFLARIGADTRKRVEQSLKDAAQKSSTEVLTEKYTVVTNGKLRFRDIPPLLCHLEDVTIDGETREAFESYRTTLTEEKRILLDKFDMVDIARKVVGIGSVGTSCGVLLLAGAENDVLILQIKEARQSVLEPYAGTSKFTHHGQRVVQGQKLMQAASDMFLGWTTGRKPAQRHFFVRQLRDMKVGVNTAYWNKDDFNSNPVVAGEILARAHARSGDAAIMRGYLGKSEAFEDAIGKYGVAYAKQTERDYSIFTNACKSGKLKVQMGD